MLRHNLVEYSVIMTVRYYDDLSSLTINGWDHINSEYRREN